MRNLRYVLMLVIFFIAGVLSVIFYQSYTKSSVNADSILAESYITDTPEPSMTPVPTTEWIQATTLPNQESHSYYPPKFSIAETQKMSADRHEAETGETVNYTVTIKNTGTKKKFLTHICFNHSGGVTFGCALNVNIEAGDQFNINNSMMYKTPGTYSVWLTWSQDGTNFYRPQNSGSAIVRIY